VGTWPPALTAPMDGMQLQEPSTEASLLEHIQEALQPFQTSAEPAA